MPVLGYLSKRDDRALTMPRADEGAANADGLAFHGDVLTGKLTVQEAFLLEAGRTSARTAPGDRVAPPDYDAVLKFHLGVE